MRNPIKFAVALALLLSSASAATADVVYDLVPHAFDGLQFSALGGDFVLSDAAATGPSTVYLDGHVVSGVAAPGRVTYSADNAEFQFYALTQHLPAPASSVVYQGLFIGTPTAVHLDGGLRQDLWKFSAQLLIATAPGVFNTPGQFYVVFDNARPQGTQVEYGSLTISSSSVPEPASFAMVACGLGLAVVVRRSRRSS